MLPEYYDFSTQDERDHGLIRCTSRASYHYSPASSGKNSSHICTPCCSIKRSSQAANASCEGNKTDEGRTSGALETLVRRNVRGNESGEMDLRLGCLVRTKSVCYSSARCVTTQGRVAARPTDAYRGSGLDHFSPGNMPLHHSGSGAPPMVSNHVCTTSFLL